ncbi:cadherin-related family member 5 isoform X1 [Python bivittatus]|uniref:Cadherin-related family member 5 isoform X1 n=1 Tax=Python bivittatus TaxID=176946 RepID=A0A9F3W1E6_PYTBI|nr:cadherin-related family member 5 isoform X1 [Python bivittatus]
MAFLNLFCSFVLFLLVSVMQVQTQSARCSVDKHVVEIKENNQRGLVIANISADPGITVTIEPSTANSHSEWFEIKSSQLILKVSVDFENITALQVQMACWKEHLKVQSLSVLITITGENDNYPEFKETNITVDVSEDTKVNTTVIPLANVTATDADLDVLFYSLEGSPPQAMDYFSIQGINNPQIYLRKDLDYEAINFMEFTLRAMDGRAGTAGIHTATATIYIRIIESDLRPPWFQPCTVIEERIMCISLGYTGKVSLSEDVSGPLILEPGPLHAIDGEKSLNEKVVYKIAAGNDYNTFSINEDSGNITMNKPANTLKPFMLYIVASQENNPYRYSQTTVKIDVVRKNDNQPYFEETIYTGRVSVDQPAKTLIMKANASSEPLQIFAADDDFLPDKINPDIKYRIQNSSDFRVTAEGFIQTTVVLSASSHITLLAIATDTSTLEEASTLISVDVTPLATPTVPPVATSASTETSPTIPGEVTTSSKPSALPPGISSLQPSISSGSTKSMSPPSSTTGKPDFTKITGNSVTVTVPGSVIPPFVTTLKPPVITGNSSQLLTTDSPVTGISQATVGSDKTSSSSAQASLQTGTTTGRSVTSGTVQSLTSSQIAITKTPTAGASPAPDDSRQSTTATSLTGITKPSTTGRFVTTNGGTVQSLTSSQTAITKTPIAGASPAPDSGRQSTTATPSTGITKLSTTGLYTVEDMAALGATLGILLAIALALLALMSYKYYKLKKELEKESLRITEGFSNLLYDKVSNLQDGKNSDSGVEDDQSSANLVSMSYAEERESENNQAPAAYETIQEEEIEDLDSEKEVRSILTKDRKMEDDGYKAVWFREDVVPEAKGDVVVIEDDSDLEQNGVDSENDSTADEDDYNNNTDSSRGDSDITDSPKRAQLLSVNPSASQSLEGEEENDAL